MAALHSDVRACVQSYTRFFSWHASQAGRLTWDADTYVLKGKLLMHAQVPLCAVSRQLIGPVGAGDEGDGGGGEGEGGGGEGDGGGGVGGGGEGGGGEGSGDGGTAPSTNSTVMSGS